MIVVAVRGVAKALAALKNQQKKKSAATRRGLKKAGLLLQRESQTLCPVLTGNLRNSAFTRVGKSLTHGDIVFVGYTAEYAIFVHENTGAYHHVGQAKFLEAPARRLEPEMRRIIAEEVKKG